MSEVFRLAQAFILASAFFVCATTADGNVPVAMSAAQPASSVTHTLTGTIRRAHEDGIEVINGVQLALKLTYITVDADTEIHREDESISLRELRVGELVTVTYHTTERGKMATHITVQPSPASRGT